jgi:hypothetical protein
LKSPDSENKVGDLKRMYWISVDLFWDQFNFIYKITVIKWTKFFSKKCIWIWNV